MAYKVKYYDDTEETVEADGFRDIDKKWTDFYSVGEMGGTTTVLRVPSDTVIRIEQG